MERTSTGRRGGGRAARLAALTARAIESVRFLTCKLAEWVAKRKASFPDSDV